MMTSPEDIQSIAGRIGLSRGDLLGMAREVARDATLLSPEHLTQRQRALLMQWLELEAQPIAVHLPPDFERRYCRKSCA